MNWVAAAPILGVVVAPFVTYLAARRKSSGSVDTTEAGTLWAEADRMRQSYRDETERFRNETLALRAEVASLRADNQTLQETCNKCRIETLALRQEVDELEKKLGEKRDR